MKKKKVLFQTDFSIVKTGFGRNAKAVLSYLYKTGKYDLVNYCCGISENHPHLSRTPWKSVGCMPSDENKLKKINEDPKLKHITPYGAFNLDKVIDEERPDVYITAQDIWGVDFALQKKWFNQINSVIWTTLDSLPILPSAIDAAKKCQNFWVWSSFAEKEMRKMGIKNVRTVHGAVDEKFFFNIGEEKKKKIRSANDIDQEDFIVGFVFRNQLRKSVPNLIKGFKHFKEKYKKTKLLLHTSYDEGWDIPTLVKENRLNPESVLVTHVCEDCLNYSVKCYKKNTSDCTICGAKDKCKTVAVDKGVSEESLNEIYNLMDVYCHPFTSGGQEVPIQEAKLAELITLVTNYSCGVEMCEPEAESLPLNWDEYREIGTQFKKANTCHNSIYEQLKKVYLMSKEEREEKGKKARKWTLENYSIQKIGRFIEDFIDDCDSIPIDQYPKPEKKDPTANVKFDTNALVWVKSLYSNILKINVDNNDEGLQHWLKRLKDGLAPAFVEEYFREVALKELLEEEGVEGIIDLSENPRRILFISPQSISDCLLLTSLFESAKAMYPEHDIFVSCHKSFSEIFTPNPYVTEVLPQLSNDPNHIKKLEKESFDVVFDLLNNGDLHNNKDRVSFDLQSQERYAW